MTPFEARMDELRQSFLARAADERTRIAAATHPLDRSVLRDASHKLAGVAAIFGYPRIGEAAIGVEAALDDRLADEDILARCAELTAALSAAASPIPAATGTPQPSAR